MSDDDTSPYAHLAGGINPSSNTSAIKEPRRERKISQDSSTLPYSPSDAAI